MIISVQCPLFSPDIIVMVVDILINEGLKVLIHIYLFVVPTD